MKASPISPAFHQIQKVVMALGDYMGVSCHACIGGTNVREDQRILSGGEGGVHVVVGTPGRVYDMINRRALDPRFVPARFYKLFIEQCRGLNLYDKKREVE